MMWSGTDDVTILADQVFIPDELVGKLQPFDSYCDLDINLNAAVRLWLQSRGAVGLEP